MKSRTLFNVLPWIAALGVVLMGYAAWHSYNRYNSPWQWKLPAHFPVPRVPEDNPMSEVKFELGRFLFYDKRVSGDGTLACASCHLQALAFTDGKAASTGGTGSLTPRSAQHLANSAYHPYFTWANYSLVTMERQMINPLLGENPVEMGVNDGNLPAILERLRVDRRYQDLFDRAFPKDAEPISLENIVKAIATFQRGMISANSRYDQHLQKKAKLTANEERGRQLFFSDQGQCSHCHGSFNFNDQVISAGTRQVTLQVHNTGLYNLDGKGAFPAGNGGIFELSNLPKDAGMFRAPSLRNVAVTAPYMHDGSLSTLEEVLDFYANHGRDITSGPFRGDGRKNPNKDPRIDRISLNAQDKADLIAFLKTLTDDEFLKSPRFSDPFELKP